MLDINTQVANTIHTSPDSAISVSPGIIQVISWTVIVQSDNQALGIVTACRVVGPKQIYNVGSLTNYESVVETFRW